MTITMLLFNTVSPRAAPVADRNTMATPDFKSAYKTIMDDHFPPRMEISFVDGDGAADAGLRKGRAG